MVRLRDLERSASPSWVGGIFQDCLASRRGCWESASLRKLGKQGFPDLRNLAAGCGYGAWGRRGLLLLTNLGYRNLVLPLFGISGAALLRSRARSQGLLTLASPSRPEPRQGPRVGQSQLYPPGPRDGLNLRLLGFPRSGSSLRRTRIDTVSRCSAPLPTASLTPNPQSGSG